MHLHKYCIESPSIDPSACMWHFLPCLFLPCLFLPCLFLPCLFLPCLFLPCLLGVCSRCSTSSPSSRLLTRCRLPPHAHLYGSRVPSRIILFIVARQLVPLRAVPSHRIGTKPKATPLPAAAHMPMRLTCQHSSRANAAHMPRTACKRCHVVELST